MSGISESQVSRLCEEIDEKVKARHATLESDRSHCWAPVPDRATNNPLACGRTADRSCAFGAADASAECRPDGNDVAAEPSGERAMNSGARVQTANLRGVSTPIGIVNC